MLPGVVWWSVPTNTALPNGVGKSLSAETIPIVQAFGCAGDTLAQVSSLGALVPFVSRAILWTQFDSPTKAKLSWFAT